MKANTNFDLLFRAPLKSNFENKSIFKKAALLFEFDLEQEFSKFPKTEFNLLKSKTLLRNNGNYILPEDLRKKIILEEIGLDNIVNEINKNETKSEFSETLLKLVKTYKVDYKQFSDSELFYLAKVVELFPEKLNLDLIKDELQRRYYFSPFIRITENFAGRKKELVQINDYVDWLPKKGIINKTIGVLRNIINWHEKPPLLIQGIGGIGKSTLISKFILDHNIAKDGKTIPFIYIDFDLPGFSLTEPLSILLEGLRQLSIQYSSQRKIFSAISQNISDMISYTPSKESDIYQSSTISSRGLIFDSVEDLIQKYSWGLDKINTPVLIVFDSFEEMQYRASRDEMNSFFSFIKEISEKVPRIRPIFIGRSEISDSTLEFEFEIIELTSFDNESANALLQNSGVNDTILRKKIYSNFGGNPLLLQLAANLIIKDKSAIKDLNKIIEKKHEYLVNRILEQIHDPHVRKIAVPGMLLRSVSPDIIKDILAIPCNLGEIDSKTAEQIFNNLSRETSLISKCYDSNKLIFRQDLRKECEKMIYNKYPKESEQIRRKAIEYFKENKAGNIDLEAEYYFHVLKIGNIPEELDRNKYIQIRGKLENSISELPSNSQLYLRSLIGSKVSDTILKQSRIIEWENYYLSQIKRGLSGEISFLKKLYKEINNRKERSRQPDSTFPLYEALLYQRLNELNESNDLIESTIEEYSNRNQSDSLPFELRLILTQNLEYNEKYEDALVICENNYLEDFNLVKEFSLKKNELLNLRLAKRCGHEEPKIKQDFANYVSNKDDVFVDIHWNYIFRHFKKYNFLDSRRFYTLYNEHKDSLLNEQELERYCMKRFALYLKDITLSGEYELVFRDFLYIIELNEDTNFKNNLTIYK